MYDYEKLIHCIRKRQDKPFESAGYNFNDNVLQDYLEYMNSHEEECSQYGFKGTLYRVHVPLLCHVDNVDDKCEIVTKSSEGEHCYILKNIQYNDKIVSFTKDLTLNFLKPEYKNMLKDLICLDTKDMYGIDVCKLMRFAGMDNERFDYEQEVLFPLTKEYVFNVKRIKGKY